MPAIQEDKRDELKQAIEASKKDAEGTSAEVTEDMMIADGVDGEDMFEKTPHFKTIVG